MYSPIFNWSLFERIYPFLFSLFFSLCLPPFITPGHYYVQSREFHIHSFYLCQSKKKPEKTVNRPDHTSKVCIKSFLFFSPPHHFCLTFLLFSSSSKSVPPDHSTTSFFSNMTMQRKYRKMTQKIQKTRISLFTTLPLFFAVKKKSIFSSRPIVFLSYYNTHKSQSPPFFLVYFAGDFPQWICITMTYFP